MERKDSVRVQREVELLRHLVSCGCESCGVKNYRNWKIGQLDSSGVPVAWRTVKLCDSCFEENR